MNVKPFLFMVLALGLALGGCVDAPRNAGGNAQDAARSTSPLSGAKSDRRRFQAEAIQVEQVPGYTYVYVRPESGEPVWVATLSRPLVAGDDVRVTLIASRDDFRSNHLGRVFPTLHFGVVVATR